MGAVSWSFDLQGGIVGAVGVVETSKCAIGGILFGEGAIRATAKVGIDDGTKSGVNVSFQFCGEGGFAGIGRSRERSGKVAGGSFGGFSEVNGKRVGGAGLSVRFVRGIEGAGFSFFVGFEP